MNRYTKLRDMLEQLIELEERLVGGYNAWYSEEGSPEEMAECGPSDQYIISCEMDEIRAEMIDILK